MKKEGTGKLRNPAIAFDAVVRMRELRFKEAPPQPEVRFRGSTRRNSVWGSRRENLPDELREGFVYRNVGVRLRIASETVDSDPGFQHSSDKERVKGILGYWGRKAGEQKTESKEEKK